jgi:hypothetical protein
VSDPTTSAARPTATEFADLLTRLKDTGSTPVVSRPDGEEWGGMIARTTAPHRICEVDEETYDYFLEVLPPRWMGRGFAFAEGGDDIRLFWKTGGRFLCRQLSADETDEFYRLIGSSRCQ